MKKIISFALSIMMIATMSVTAFAETITSDNGNASIPVTGTYQSGGTAGEGTISVDVSWSSMEFTYTGASQGTWNPASHTYDNGTNGGWSTNKGTITVKNHSNVAVTATLAWTQNAAITGTITGTFSGDDVKNNVMELVSADNDAYRSTDPNVTPAAPAATAQFGISGDAIDKNYNAEENGLGTITVTIAKKASN